MGIIQAASAASLNHDWAAERHISVVTHRYHHRHNHHPTITTATITTTTATAPTTTTTTHTTTPVWPFRQAHSTGS